MGDFDDLIVNRQKLTNVKTRLFQERRRSFSSKKEHDDFLRSFLYFNFGVSDPNRVLLPQIDQQIALTSSALYLTRRHLKYASTPM